MTNDALSRLLQAVRPFRPFEVEIAGEKFKYKARKPGSAETQDNSRAWDKAYEAAIVSFDDSKVDATALYNNLKRASAERLAEFVVSADKREIEADVLNFLDKKEADGESKEEVDRQVKERTAKLISDETHESLLGMAMDRRRHYFALGEANEELTRTLALTMIFTEDESPLFSSLDQVRALPDEVLTTMVVAANEVLKDPETPLA